MPQEKEFADIKECIGGIITNAFMDSSKQLLFLSVWKDGITTTYEIFLKRRDK